MRIGVDARRLREKNLTGIGMYVYYVLKYLQAYDNTNEYILYMDREPLHWENRSENFKIRIIRGNKLEKKIGSLWLEYKVGRYLKEDNIDVFWGPEQVLPKIPSNVKSVVTIHDVALWVNEKWGKRSNVVIQKLLVPKALKRTDHIIAISEATKKDLINIFNIDKNKISVVYDGLYISDNQDISSQNATSTKEKYGINGKYFLYLGTLEPRKNVDLLIRAFDKVCDKNPDIYLVLAGGLGWKYENVLKEIEKARNREKIIRTGYVSQQEKLDLFSATEAFVFPSYYEGFGAPVIEAMHMNALVITTSNSSLPEVGGEAAFYIKDEDNEMELALLMESVLQMSTTERKNRLEKGKQQYQKFPLDKCAKETLSVLLKNIQ